MTVVVFGLGANLGDRLAALQTAVDVIGETVRITSVSSVYTTEPVGGPEQPEYLNAVVIGETDVPATNLLDIVRDAETRLARTRDVRWGPRTLDVDVLAYGAVEQDDEALTLPHPRAADRAFVMVPWAEIDPDSPFQGSTVSAVAARLPTDGVVLRSDLRLTWGSDT